MRRKISPNLFANASLERVSRTETPRKAKHTSVPPLAEANQRSFLTCSYIHWKPSGGKGEPVEPRPRSLLRSNVLPGSISAFMQASINPALVPKNVIPDFSAYSHRAFILGYDGLPS